jgi:prevent-host-death family protein
MVTMTRVSVTELKARLSRYLREVRRGGEIQVEDRGVPVARLVGLPPAGGTSEAECRDRLVQAGILRPGSGDAARILARPPVELRVDISGALEDERADRL